MQFFFEVSYDFMRRLDEAGSVVFLWSNEPEKKTTET